MYMEILEQQGSQKKNHSALTLASFPIRSECVAISAFTHAGAFGIREVLFTPMGASSTVINLWVTLDIKQKRAEKFLPC